MLRMRQLVQLATLAALVPFAALASACPGGLIAPPTDAPIEPGGDDDDDDDDDPPLDLGPEAPAPSTRLFRLTRVQWENTVRDLLRLDATTGFSSELAEDALPAGFLFDNPGGALSIDSTQWAAFGRASALAAEFVTVDDARRARILPAVTGGAAEETAAARAFIEDIGLRAHRRPLSTAEVDRYLAIYESGRTLYDGVPAHTAGARLVLEAMLQSPLFLYRVEASIEAAPLDDTEAGAQIDVIPLDGFERASRLSYALWNTMPDDDLFIEAADGTLDDPAGVESAVTRMLDDERAAVAVQHFFAQLLEMEKLEGIAPSAQLFPDVPVDLAGLARAEAELFLAHVFTTSGGVNELLTSSTTFANRDLARIYGYSDEEADALGDELAQVELDPSTRKGIFTHVAFLAQNATSPDPIHRGVFLARHMACIPISAPPNDIPPLPPPQDFETNRERVERHTEQEGSICADCHQYTINPFGFPFEMYDAVGAVRATDSGLPIDTATEVALDDFVPVADAVELMDAMAASKVVHDCTAQHWLEFSMGRAKSAEDAPLIARLGNGSLDGRSMKQLLTALVTSPAFLSRSVVELEEGGGQ
jgi:hypothetical protein